MSTTDTTGIPTPKEELERKTLEFLEHLLHRYQTGRVSPETAVSQAKAIWTVTAGLVGHEISSLAQMLSDEIVAKAEQKSIYLRNAAGGLIRIRYAQEKPNFVVRKWGSAGYSFGEVTEVKCEAGAERQAKLKQAITNLVSGGYELI